MNYAIVLTGGSGKRIHNSMPKQFIKIKDKELFLYSLDTFLACEEIKKVYLVINKEYEQEYINVLKKYNYLDRICLIYGGKTRHESVNNAVEFIKKSVNKEDIVLIHDGARPLLSKEIIDRSIHQIKTNKKPVSTIIKIVDTIVDKDYNLYDRNNLFLVQTPQTFIYSQLLDICKKDMGDDLNATDEIQLAKKAGFDIDYVMGSRNNFKVTIDEDLEVLEKLLEG